MISRILSFLFGIAIIALLLYLGKHTVDNTNFVIWFGLITALLAPVAYELLKYSFISQKGINKLLKVTEIQSLIEKATTLDDKIRVLKIQQQHLNEIIEIESRKKSLLAEKDIYISLAEKSLNEIKKIDISLKSISNEVDDLPENLKQLHNLIQNQSDMKDAIIIRTKTKIYTIDKSLFDFFIFGDIAFYIIQKVNKKINTNQH